jgi:DNA-binding HxlR family transcriptional regulator
MPPTRLQRELAAMKRDGLIEERVRPDGKVGLYLTEKGRQAWAASDEGAP